MDVQGNLYDLFTNSIDELFHVKGVCLFHNSLAKIITKLIDHNIGDDRSDGVDKTFGEGLSLWWLRLLDLHGCGFLSAWALSDGVLDHLLQHSAACLVEAIVIESCENVLLFGGKWLVVWSNILFVTILRLFGLESLGLSRNLLLDGKLSFRHSPNSSEALCVTLVARLCVQSRKWRI